MAYDRERDPKGDFARNVVYWVRLSRVTQVLGITGGMVALGAKFHFSPEEVEEFVGWVISLIPRYIH